MRSKSALTNCMGFLMHDINVSLVYALPDRQWLYETKLARGCSATDLLEKSNFLNDIAELQGRLSGDLQMGVYAQRIDPDYLLEEGDRVEIYRPLTADPKEVRRQLALIGKTMGNAKASKK